MCTLFSIFFRATEQAQTYLKIWVWHPIKHVFVPACLSVRKVPKICPCILPCFPFVGSKNGNEIFVKRVFTIFASNVLFWALVGRHFGRNCTKKISSSSLMVGICHLTDSHHNHHGQKPTMVGICHGGNMLGNPQQRVLFQCPTSVTWELSLCTLWSSSPNLSKL